MKNEKRRRKKEKKRKEKKKGRRRKDKKEVINIIHRYHTTINIILHRFRNICSYLILT